MRRLRGKGCTSPGWPRHDAHHPHAPLTHSRAHFPDIYYRHPQA